MCVCVCVCVCACVTHITQTYTLSVLNDCDLNSDNVYESSISPN